MTEFWVSNKNFWCEYCKVWMADNPNARATHERGMKHQEMVARKLRDMRKKTASDKKEAEDVASSLKSIEAKAQKQFAEDQKAAEEATQALGHWEKHNDSGYWYNAQQQYYYDSKTGMYYGGDPPAWTLTPEIPAEARYGAALRQADSNGAEPARSPAPAAGVAASSASRVSAKVRLMPKHPSADLGGYQMPALGSIGGAKGVGSEAVQSGGSGRRPAAAGDNQKKRKADKPLSKEEQAAIAQREAARLRVQKRTLSNFGLG